ncbi:MAG: alpha/beta fold hydrolase [Anaerolineales bacterium]|nr:alpha/beta fold hydrolase [Anaerolineales bacterium]
MQNTLNKIGLILGILMVAGALMGLSSLDDALANGKQVEIPVLGDDTLIGTYYPGNLERGLLLLEGFGSDQTSLRPIAAEYAGRGYHVLSFDFSGHGRSPGGLDFDNAATDRMAKQVLAADTRLQELSGLASGQIIHLGHSLGARVALQAATMTDSPPESLILLGAQVNLATNQQAEFFTGTSDTDLEWVQALGPDNPKTNIILFTSQKDDILTPESAQLLVNQLSGNTSSNYGRELILAPKLLHNYEIYAKDAIKNQAGYFPSVSYWLLGLAGLFLALITRIDLTRRSGSPAPEARIEKPGWFIAGKLLLWVPALIPGAIIASAIFFSPFGTPAFNLYYIGFFGGYGVLLWFLYLKGRVPGVTGRVILRRNSDAIQQKAYLAGFYFLAVLLAVSLMARSGWWYTFAFNHRLVWLLVFTLITALGFRIGYEEIEIIRASQPRKGWLVWLNALAGLFPFFLYTAFLASIGSISGVTGSVQGLVILGLSNATGILVEKISARPWLAAMLQAFLLYWLILPQGVLFR